MVKYSTKERNSELLKKAYEKETLKLTIQLGDNEIYELLVNNPIKIEDVSNIIVKLNKLNKLDYVPNFGTNGNTNGKLEYENKILKQTYKGKRRMWCNTREKAVALMIMANFGDEKDRQEFCKHYNEDWPSVGKSLHDLRRRYIIKPKETGLIRYPKIGETNRGMRYKLIIPEFKGEDKIYLWKKYI